ncbi:helix-turn-helix domain-containing protein [Sporomusa sphaeroides DSM 2875]|uniref:helix-turn-helix domain-containing protein n=1 Tax=Sporomusa sphaeroides TaxID=47679 RepID=UPI0020303756|nr:helix-turn-helix transcriptional regulator [Sporomusa sphaeroides]MCM0760473.1 helix-turn-helix domain-containing protein [Sporomusa sphaeroides DSM 2875]
MKSLLFQGKKLKHLREARNLTMQEIEEMTGIKQSTQSDIETEKNRNPRPATVDKLCRVFGVEPIFFYYTGDNLKELFPSEISPELREFIFDISNLPYIQLALDIKHLKVKPESAKNVVVAFAKALAMNEDK